MKNIIIIVTILLVVILASCNNNTDDDENVSVVDTDEVTDTSHEEIVFEEHEEDIVDGEQTDEHESLCGTEDAVCRFGDLANCGDIISDTYSVNQIECKLDCSGWETESCAKAYGKIDISAVIGYLMDIEKTSDQSYVLQFEDEIIRTEPVFSGIIGGREFPGETFTDAEVYSYKYEYEDDQGVMQHVIIIKQLAWHEMELLSPTVEIAIPAIPEEGDNGSINIDEKGIKLVAYDGQQFQKAECTHGFGSEGFVTFTKTVDLDKSEGGQISFSGDNIPFFHITETPRGDLSEAFDGGSVCEKEGS